ncbi:MAG: methyltransferase domain-containing protein [Patescibacteria group bacterium]|nr:methyltransferase domain-containing protein [Patescibacteria group bacterium]MDD4610881.1 methyltransferase domain-containing protein [Patescibacteria group bacterium]
MLDNNFWKKYFQVYDVLNIVIPYQELLDAIIKEAEIKDGDVILDAGCGTGNFELRLKKDKPELKIKVIGLENCVDGLEIYKKKIKGANVRLADLTEKLPFENNYFDKIISNNVLFTIAHEKRLDILEEFHRVLKPGGKIIISNVICGFSAFKVFVDMIKKEIDKFGYLQFFSLFFKMFVPVMKIFYYSSLIKKECDFGDFRFMDEGEQARKLEKAGFKNISEDKIVYVGQAILNIAEK